MDVVLVVGRIGDDRIMMVALLFRGGIRLGVHMFLNIRHFRGFSQLNYDARDRGAEMDADEFRGGGRGRRDGQDCKGEGVESEIVKYMF